MSSRTEAREPIRSASAPTTSGSAVDGHREADQVAAGELDLARALDRERLAAARRRAGSASFSPACAISLRLLLGAGAELDLEAAAGEQHGDRGAPAAGADHRRLAQRRQAAEPLPLQLDVGPDPVGDRRGERRRRALGAREGHRLAGAQLAPCAGGSASRGGPARSRARRPAAPARRSRARAGRRRASGRPERAGADPRALGEDARPCRRARRSGARSPSRSRRTGRGGSGRRRAGRGASPASGFSNSSTLATNCIRRRQGSSAPITNGSRKLRWLEATIRPPRSRACSRPVRCEAEPDQERGHEDAARAR